MGLRLVATSTAKPAPFLDLIYLSNHCLILPSPAPILPSQSHPSPSSVAAGGTTAHTGRPQPSCLTLEQHVPLCVIGVL